MYKRQYQFLSTNLFILTIPLFLTKVYLNCYLKKFEIDWILSFCHFQCWTHISPSFFVRFVTRDFPLFSELYSSSELGFLSDKHFNSVLFFFRITFLRFSFQLFFPTFPFNPSRPFLIGDRSSSNV